jgi:uncharacterized protein (UPF0332 family)
VKDQTQRALARSRRALSTARKLLELEMHDIAGRQAYIASLNAARAPIFERSGLSTKTHRGVKSLMHDMVRAGLPVDRELLVILEYGFELKTTADYGEAETISAHEARKALDLAESFIGRIEKFITE